MEKNLIIIPTYNERDNIENLIISIFKRLIKVTCHILVIDDNSPDGTADIVNKIIKKYKKKLFLIKRAKKYGLGTAYIRGFQWGLKQGYELFIEMDADFSHNPAYLPEMIKLSDTYDFIIGSRYVKDGGVKGWKRWRKFLSKSGSLYAKIILFCPIHDLTGGYNIWRKETLLGIDLNSIISEGYSFQIEMKYRAYKHGFKFFEYPIIFEDRALGVSKMSKKIMHEAIIAVWKLRFGK